MNAKQSRLERLCTEIATLDPTAKAQVLQQLINLTGVVQSPKAKLEPDDFKYLVARFEDIGEVKLTVPVTLELEVTGNLVYEHGYEFSEEDSLSISNLDLEIKNKTKFEKDMGEYMHLDNYLDNYEIQELILKQPLATIKEFRTKTSEFKKSLEKMASKYELSSEDLFYDVLDKSQKALKVPGKRKAGRRWRPQT